MLYPSRIRFAPPLVIEEADLQKSIKIIGEALNDLDLVSTRFYRSSDDLGSWFHRSIISLARSRVRGGTRSTLPINYPFRR